MFVTLVSVTQQWKTWKLLTIMSYMEYGASLINVDLRFGGPYRVFKGMCKKLHFPLAPVGIRQQTAGHASHTDLSLSIFDRLHGRSPTYLYNYRTQ